MPVGVEEFFQVCNLGSQLGAFVGIGHEHAVGRHFYYLCRALDVSTPLYRIEIPDCGIREYILRYLFPCGMPR